MLRARSAEGLSALSFELESWGLLVHATYGYLKGLPFSAYGEAVMMLAQNVLLLALIYKYARMPVSRALAAAIVGVSFVAGVFTGTRHRQRVARVAAGRVLQGHRQLKIAHRTGSAAAEYTLRWHTAAGACRPCTQAQSASTRSCGIPLRRTCPSACLSMTWLCQPDKSSQPWPDRPTALLWESCTHTTHKDTAPQSTAHS